LFPDDVDGSMTVVVIALGWPLTDAQTKAVDQARALARERALVFDAILASSVDEGLAIVAARDRVLLAGDRRETRRLARALDSRGISARVAR
jgi:hypothetical protein